MLHLQLLSKMATGLWALHGAVLVAQTQLPFDPTKAADVAREKDVVWLSLVTAMLAISFSAWLVKQILTNQAAGIRAIQELREEMAKRPCVLGLPHHNED